MNEQRPESRTDRGTVTLTEAAEALGVHYMTAYRYVRTGRLAATKVSGEWRVSTDDMSRLTPGVVGSRVGQGPGVPRQVPGRGRTARSQAGARLEERLVAGDEAGAWALIEATQAGGAGPDEIYLDLLVPALRSLGDRWASGNLTVADEHRASGVALRLIGRLGPRFARPGRKRGTIVLGAPSGERHAIPVAVVADLLRQVGFEVVDLGPDTPPSSFAEAAEQAAVAGQLVAVLIGVTVPGSLASARAAAAAVAEVSDRLAAGSEAGPGQSTLPAIPVLVGGAAVADASAAEQLGAHCYTGTSGADAVSAVERLMEVRSAAS